MPDAPEAGDQNHARGLREEGEQNRQPETGVLDAHLHGDRAPVGTVEAHQQPGQGADAQCQGVLADHQRHDTVRVFQEHIHILAERQAHEGEQHQQRDHAHGLLGTLGEAWKVAAGQHAQHQGQRQHQRHQQQDVPGVERDLGDHRPGVGVQPAVEREIQRREHGGGQAGHRRHADGHRHIGPRQPGHDVGKGAARAGGHQDHAQRQLRLHVEKPGDHAGQRRQQYELRQQPRRRRFRHTQHAPEILATQGQGNPEHHQSEDHIEHDQTAGAEINRVIGGHTSPPGYCSCSARR